MTSVDNSSLHGAGTRVNNRVEPLNSRIENSIQKNQN